MFRNDDSSWANLDGGDAWALDDVIRLEIVGFTLSVYKNDALDTSIGTGGSYEDTSGSKLSGGYVGVTSFGSATSPDGDDFEAGEM